MKHVLSVGIAGILLAAAPMATAQDRVAPQWEGMQKVQWKTFDEGYRAPGVDFRHFTKVMIDPAEAAFRKN